MENELKSRVLDVNIEEEIKKSFIYISKQRKPAAG